MKFKMVSYRVYLEKISLDVMPFNLLVAITGVIYCGMHQAAVDFRVHLSVRSRL